MAINDDYVDWKITSQVAELFDPPENPVLSLVRASSQRMNSNSVILKGTTDKPIGNRYLNEFFSVIMRDAFTEMFLEFDRLSLRYDYYEWEQSPESEKDFYAGYKPRVSQFVKLDVMRKLKPMSYLGFSERLHWMVCTARSFYGEEPLEEEETLKLIRDVSHFIFSEANWTVGDVPPESLNLPGWVDHPWHFYDVIPDFLYSTGYWQQEEDPPDNAYFDGGPNDSCTLCFYDTTFYLLLTNGCP